jgi:hypothetical protein
MPESESWGKSTEDIVERICTRMFFSDFVARSPSFVKPDGISREAADLMAVFGPEILTFQVKSKLEHKPASQKSDVEFSRISQVASEAIGQLQTTRRAISNNWVQPLISVRGLPLPLPKTESVNLTGIIVLHLVGEDQFPPDDRTHFMSSFTFLEGMPVHVFLLDEFDALSVELDTMPDFVQFLGRVRALYEQQLLVLPPSILDLLAFHKMDPDALEHAITQGVTLAIEDGFWDSYQRDHAKELTRRARLNKPSYMIDAIIDFLHTSVGYSPPGDKTPALGLKGQGTVRGFLAAAYELASLSRLERRLLGEKLLRCLRKAEKKTFAFSVIIDQSIRSATLVLSSSMGRPDRQEFLYKLCAMAYCRLQLTKIIGLATEQLSAPYRSYDSLVLNDAQFSNAEELVKESDKFFGPAYRATGSEFTSGGESDA